MTKSDELRSKFISFFEKRGHKNIGFSPLVPIGDPTTLFTSSGMQPLVPYLLGEKHPQGKRLVNSQICFRAEDIEEVGDNRHTTFFEMLGNWSLGDYFKKEQLTWFFEFLVDEVGLDPKKLYATAFVGDALINIPKDSESVRILKKIFESRNINAKTVENAEIKGMQGGRIFYYGSDFGNWWSRSGKPKNMPAGEPGGPCSEIFYDFGAGLKLHEKSVFANKQCHPNCDCGRFIEIGNSVFMQYKKMKDDSFAKLDQKNVDFGGGFERILAAKNNIPDIFQTDLFFSTIKSIETATGRKYENYQNEFRIIADHIKGAVFMIWQGVEPGNKMQGYILRRLIRRAGLKIFQLNRDKESNLDLIIENVILTYKGIYFKKIDEIKNPASKIIHKEIEKFRQSFSKGMKLIENAKNADGRFIFDLWQTYGFPFEISSELLVAKGIKINKNDFLKEYRAHQELSRTAAKGMFKGGLENHSEQTARLHTATHLLHGALRKLLGPHVQQTGSNITSDRLRFDFIHPKKLTDEEIKQIEKTVNEEITKNHKVQSKTMLLSEAKKQGALSFFGQKYPESVKVYYIGSFSKELCGGPHVDFTGELGKFIIKKEKAVGSGKRRIYAGLEK